MLAHETEAERRVPLELLDERPCVQLVRRARGGDQQDCRALPDQLFQWFDARRLESIEASEDSLPEFEDAIGHRVQRRGQRFVKQRGRARRQVLDDVLKIVRQLQHHAPAEREILLLRGSIVRPRDIRRRVPTCLLLRRRLA